MVIMNKTRKMKYEETFISHLHASKLLVSRDSAIGIVSKLEGGRPKRREIGGRRNNSCPERPTSQTGCTLWRQSGWGVKLTPQRNLVPRLRTSAVTKLHF
jgi:hypothetical protein